MFQDEVVIRQEPLVIPTYAPGPAERNPMFYAGRLYQGAQGPIYPYPLLDKLTDARADRTYQAVRLENRYLQIVALPEIGGRVLAGQDKTNGYDFFYRQHVIKPALIGMLGAWISGGAEWNIPHHHRASTFLPVDFVLADAEGGAKTLWLAETELRHRMKWLVGLTLRPGRSYLEITVKLFNRTSLAHSFLYFTNAAVPANADYQVVFPPATRLGTQHAKCEFVRWPVAAGTYAGVEYAGADVSWWKNHPHSISIFAWNDTDDFFGGYDHGRRAGVCQVADRHACPGKKFFEFGNGPFGRMWDKVLTDADGPYLELMAGAYSDNQPDYSWIQPGETKTATQYWYPVRELGGIKQANRDAAVNLEVDGRGVARVAFNATAEFDGAIVLVRAGEQELLRERVRIAPDAPFVKELPLPAGTEAGAVRAALVTADGQELVAYRPAPLPPVELPRPVVPPPPPAEIKTNEELYLAGLRLEQFHSPVLAPDPYYAEALRRDPTDVRANTAVGILHCRHGRWAEAQAALTRAVARLTAHYTRPRDGEPHYYLGVAARAQRQFALAREQFERAAWSFAWRAAAQYELAEMALAEGDLAGALGHIDESLAHNAGSPRAMALQATILRRLGGTADAAALADRALALDPLDFWARNERSMGVPPMSSTGVSPVTKSEEHGRDAHVTHGQDARATNQQAEREIEELARLMRGVAQSYLELAAGYARCGQWDKAIEVLTRFVEAAADPKAVNPLVYYALGWYWEKKIGCHACASASMSSAPAAAKTMLAEAQAWHPEANAAGVYYRLGRQTPPDYCFPFQLESAEALRAAMAHDPADGRAPYYLGNLLYDHQPEEAIRAWERAAELEPGFATVHRNLALAYARIRHDLPAAVAAMRRAVECDGADPRLLTELDQLLEQQAADHAQRLALLDARAATVQGRDEAVARQAHLCVFVGQYDRAITLLAERHFHIWEGGENTVHSVHVDARLLRGRAALAAGQAGDALADFLAAADYPERFELGEPYDGGRAPEVQYWIGLAHEAARSMGVPLMSDAGILPASAAGVPPAGLGAKVHEDTPTQTTLGGATHTQAGAAFERAVARERKGTHLAYYQALAWRKLGRQDKAAALLDDLARAGQALLAGPPGADFFEKFGTGQNESARKAQGHFLIGLSHLGRGRPDEAKGEFQAAVALNVNHLAARTELAALAGN